MTIEQFWDGEPGLTRYFRRKLEMEDRRARETAWLNGYYDFVAVSTALANAFRGKGKRAHDFPSLPSNDEPRTQTEQEIKKSKAFEASLAFMEGMRVLKKGKKNADT